MLVSRSLDRDRARSAIAAARHRARARARSSRLRCDRVYFAAGSGLCVARGRGFAAGYRARDLRPRPAASAHELRVDGVPSRARVSPDGRYGSVTMFVTGHSYADAGQLLDARRR